MNHYSSIRSKQLYVALTIVPVGISTNERSRSVGVCSLSIYATTRVISTSRILADNCVSCQRLDVRSRFFFSFDIHTFSLALFLPSFFSYHFYFDVLWLSDYLQFLWRLTFHHNRRISHSVQECGISKERRCFRSCNWSIFSEIFRDKWFYTVNYYSPRLFLSFFIYLGCWFIYAGRNTARNGNKWACSRNICQ